MDNQPSFDHSLIIPLLIGGFSVVGIFVVLLIGRALNSPAEVAVTPSATPFQYVYLGTEPVVTTPLIEGSDTAPLTDEPTDAFPSDDTPNFVAPTRPSVATPLILGTSVPPSPILLTSTPGGIPTSVPGTAAVLNTYDDTDSQIVYIGNWFSQTDVSGAYLGTLHRSDTTGDLASLLFTGQEIHLFYQSGPSLGILTIVFDENAQEITLNQAQGSGEWVYMLDTAAEHTVTLMHSGGGSVNIDRIVIPALTPAPTPTPTPTQ